MKIFLKIVLAISYVLLLVMFAEGFLYLAGNAEIQFCVPFDLIFKNFTVERAEQYELYRRPVGLEYKRAPIVIYGCSIAYGYHLKDEETFSYKLSEYTKRPVYNYSIMGRNIQHALYLMQKCLKLSLNLNMSFISIGPVI